MFFKQIVKRNKLLIVYILIIFFYYLQNLLAQSFHNNYIFKQVMPRSQWMDYRPDEPHRAVILNGEGGAIVASVALGPAWLLVQKIDRYGNVLWAEPGQARKVALDTPGNDENYAPIMVSDGNGGAFITYAYGEEKYDSLYHWYNYDVYVQHIARDFERLWGDRGIAVSAIDSIIYEYPFGIVPDGEGGVMVLFTGPKEIENPYGTVYIQRINESGELLWQKPGIIVSSPDTLGVRRLIPDDNGGAFLFGAIKYAQHINIEGQFLWQLPYVSTGLPHLPWLWFFKNNESINTILIAGYNRAQKIFEEDGSIIWGKSGVLWDHPTIIHYNPIITRNDNGGALLFFSHFVQELDKNGIYVFDNPISVIDTTKFKYKPYPISGEYAVGYGAFVLYVSADTRQDPKVKLIMQKISANGDLPWGTSGVTICDTTVFLNHSHSLIKIDPELNEAFIFVEFHQGIFVMKVDLDTGSPITIVKSRYKQIPTEFQLSAHPNPFTNFTSLNITGLNSSYSKFTIKIYDVLGKEVIDLSHQFENNQINWKGVDFQNQSVAPGIYFVKVKGENHFKVRKILKIN